MASDLNPSDFDIPREKERTDIQRDDINIAWKFADGSTQLLDSTDGHLAILRAIQYGRKADAAAAVDGDVQWNAACEQALKVAHAAWDKHQKPEEMLSVIRSLKRLK